MGLISTLNGAAGVLVMTLIAVFILVTLALVVWAGLQTTLNVVRGR